MNINLMQKKIGEFMELDTGGNAFAFSPSPVLPIVTVISFSTFAVNNVHLY